MHRMSITKSESEVPLEEVRLTWQEVIGEDAKSNNSWTVGQDV